MAKLNLIKLFQLKYTGSYIDTSKFLTLGLARKLATSSIIEDCSFILNIHSQRLDHSIILGLNATFYKTD